MVHCCSHISYCGAMSLEVKCVPSLGGPNLKITFFQGAYKCCVWKIFLAFFQNKYFLGVLRVEPCLFSEHLVSWLTCADWASSKTHIL